VRKLLCAALLLTGCAAAYVEPSPVRLISTATTFCSSVQVDACHAVTAAHCFEPGAPGAVVVQLGDVVEAEGWGCGAQMDGWRVKARRMRRRAKISAINRMLVGYELELSIPLCHGDSGGALWDRDGRLIGVLTGTSRTNGYATPWPRDCATP